MKLPGSHPPTTSLLGGSTPPAGGRLAELAASPRLLGWLLVLSTILAYLPAFQAKYIWDDDAYVINNLTLRTLGGLLQIWFQPAATPQYYPLVHTSFWLEYHLWGLNPAGYHATNVLLHALAAVLLWRALERLRVPGAWLAALIFALHPVAVESVAWVTERKNVLSAVFYFAAALSYWRWADPLAAEGPSTEPVHGSRHWYFIALALFLAALWSKTVTCTLPAALLLVIWWQRGRLTLGDIRPLVPFFALGAGLGGFTAWLERTHVSAVGPEWDFSLFDRCLIAGRALWFYAATWCWPFDLTFIYPRWQINAGVGWQWLFPAGALAVMGLLWALRQRLGRGPLVAVLFFAGTLFPALGFNNIYPMRFSFVADHFQYLATIGPIVPVTAALLKLPRPLSLARLFLPMALAVLTWKQTLIYADEQTLWEDTLAKNPACWMAHYNLGLLLENQGQTNAAMSHYESAFFLKPDYFEPRYNLGNILVCQGQLDAAISQFQVVLHIKPDEPKAWNNLGLALAREGQLPAAIQQYQTALHYDPDNVEAHVNLGVVFDKQGQSDLAIAQYQAALRRQPDQVEALNNLGIALARKGQWDDAISEFQAVLRLRPRDVLVQNNLARALALKQQSAGRANP